VATRRQGSLKLHLRTIRRSTRIIARSFNKLEARLRRLERQAKRAVPGKRRPVRLTRARRAQLKLQGQYMGTIRGLKPAQKAKVKAVKERRGMEAAIRIARGHPGGGR
jgi:hypothetical protein